MAPNRGPAVPRRRLGAELRRLREEAGLLIEDIAKELECSTSKISRLENGKGIPKIRDVRDMLTRYGVTDVRVRDRLLQWVHAGQQQGWWQEFSDVMQQEPATAQLDTYIGLEADAERKWEYQSSVVPGLLQTASYARDVLASLPFDFNVQQLDRLVELRLRRQEILFRADAPLQFTCVIDEAVLRRPVGGPAEMSKQLQEIARAAARPNIDVHVLPLRAGAHAAMINTFELLEFPGESDHEIVMVESLTGTTYLEGESDVKRYRKAILDLARRALKVECFPDLFATNASTSSEKFVSSEHP